MKKLKLEELGRISVEEFKKQKKLPVCIVLDNVRGLHNVGSAFRTADAFRLKKLFSRVSPAPPWNSKSAGATESVAWEYFESASEAVKNLKTEGYEVLIIEQTTGSVPAHEFVPALEKNTASCSATK